MNWAIGGDKPVNGICPTCGGPCGPVGSAPRSTSAAAFPGYMWQKLIVKRDGDYTEWRIGWYEQPGVQA